MSADWPRRAACKDKPAQWWFPEGGMSPDAAIRVCFECPVREECLQFALTTNQSDGIWGGLEIRERLRQRQYRVIYCNYCGKTFTWLPIGGNHPKFCSSSCRRSSRAKTESLARQRRLGRLTGRTCGFVSTYNSGCRCEDCKRAATESKQRQRSKKRSANEVV